MSFERPFNSSRPEPAGSRVPWQYRVRPALFLTVSSVVAVLLCVGAFICLRRFNGALSTELASGAMLAMALGTAITVYCARIAWRRSFPLESPSDLSRTDLVLGYASSAALALLAVGCCYPANRNSDWLIWLPILVADQFWRQNFFDAGEPWVPVTEEEFSISTTNSLVPPESAVQLNPEQEDIVQQLYRVQDHGYEVIYGTLRADFVAGQRTAVVHAGFCPPLTYVPEIEAEALPGTTVKIKTVQALAHGTRLDVRLPAPAETDKRVWIDMAARPAGQQPAGQTA